PLIDDLKVLWAKPCVETIDVATGLKFNMRVMVLWTTNDFPARSSLSGWSGQGYKACPTCNKDTPSVRVLSKTTYVGHRRFLKKPHKWRSSLEFNGKTDNKDPSKEFGWDEILAQLDRLPTRVKGKHPSYGESYFMLTLLIPGPKSPGKNIDVYLRPLIDDLKVLWAKPCVETIDVATGLKFNMRVMVLWTINDFPDRSKTAFVGHRRFLKKPHKWRRSLEFNGENKTEILLENPIMTQLAHACEGHHQGKTRLEKAGHSKWLVARPKQKEKCSKPQAAYSFTPEDRKKFCQFIKGVKLPDGFGSKFKHKDTDNDINITGLKSHDYHIMMQRLLPYGLQQYLAPDVAKPLIELCLFFKQICSQTLMVDDMLKAHSKVIDILCNLELIYPPSFFDIMIHLVIHLPLEAIFGGLIRPRWMYPFEKYIKKLKNYVQNKAKPEGSIAEGYVAKEALTFSFYYFRDVTTKFNRPDRNVDCPPLTCQLQVFKSLCKSIGLRSVIRIDHQELKKVIWYVLHNSPEIDTYRAKFKMYIRQRHLDNDPGVNESSELFALAYGPSQTPISVNSCVVNRISELCTETGILEIQ
nr:hypothetical protein [Tanacetum cinerariifolium]